ncbi:hypothetical protein SKAU_G00403030 [Synaphobranchus kaupii]|uniref:Apple domain-containing protein n=1 Tax=Synaphobranchus kaupii TaxID=118154 RepID=A0A9Q1ICI4_SYNKA|nr:hypothetical protein SKAU_G00403030 [Synaphobranchus kaupii]
MQNDSEFAVTFKILECFPAVFSSECVRELQVDVDFPGSDILQILSPDVHHCQRACTQHHSCLFFTFIRPEWNWDKRQFYCYLKHTDSGKL